MEERIQNYGDKFQRKSKYVRGKLPNHYLDWSTKPSTYKSYDSAISISKLPKPGFNLQINYWDVVINRQSIRNFSEEPITTNELSLLLFSISGLTRIYPQFTFRTIPSAGGLYPIETYIIINNVENVKKGLYHYFIPDHSLECLKLGDLSCNIAAACLDQKLSKKAAVNFVWTAIIERSRWKYLQRCYRYIYMDVGHIGQNFYLTASALNLGACTIGAIYDDELNQLLGIDGIDETAIYVGVVGKKISRDNG